MRVSVVLCEHTLERYDDFVEAAESVLCQTYDNIELVLVSDGNEAVYSRFQSDYGERDNVVVHCNEENVGLLESRNNGAEIASGDIVAFLDDDAIAEEDWVEELVEVYQRRDVQAVGGRMTPAWVAGKPRFLPEEFYWLVGVTHRGFGPNGDETAAGEVRNTFGSNISFRREVFLELGGFDGDIGGRTGDNNLQGGETELCARLRDRYDQGVYYNPDATVAHKVFSYRTDPRWLLDRAFWQGYSKRGMESFVTESTDEEDEFARRLLTEFFPDRILGLIARPTLNGVLQLVMLVLLTISVGVGYTYGSLKYRGTRVHVQSETEDPTYSVLWLRPSRGDNISVRRKRISEKLATRGVTVDIVDVTGSDLIPAVLHAVTGDYDAIFGNVRMGLYVGYPIAKLTGRPFVGTVSDPISDIDYLPRPLFETLRRYEWFVLSRADACTFTYQDDFEEARSRGIDGRKLPNAVDYDKFATPDDDVVERTKAILAEEGVDLDSPIAIYIGGLTEETYRISDIIDAASRSSDWEFVFVGEGEEHKRVETAARERENVHYPGAFEYDLMPGFLSHATVGFCFKDAEQPLKIAEYGAAGLVTFAQRGELSERFADDEVYFVEPTADAIAEGLATLREDPDSVEQYGSNLRTRARDVSWQEVADEYYDILWQINHDG